TVVQSAIQGSDQTVGEDLQTGMFVSLQGTPPAATNVTVMSNDPAIAIVSIDPNAAGGASATFFGVTNTSVGTVYVQGLLVGTTTLTMSAPNYANSNVNVTVTPSGFYIATPGNFTTNTFATNTTIQLRSARLNPITLNVSTDQSLRGGHAPVAVTVSSSD